ncbi:MAG: LytTR family DNA-binding domain-containing protein [Candidatus Cryptobacteroides sp.]
MKNKTEILTGGPSCILHALAVPFFLFIFSIIYSPFGIKDMLAIGRTTYSFNLSILLSITLLCYALCRGILFIFRKKLPDNMLLYSAICVAELIVASLFSSLYLTLLMRGEKPFFEVEMSVLGIMSSMAVFPYSLLSLGLLFHNADKKSDGTDTELPGTSLIRFTDEYQKLRLVVAPESVMFIRSEENYVIINYLDHGKLKKFNLRSSMKSLEEMLGRHGLIRCHRSYFLNPNFVKLVNRDESGTVFAHLSVENTEPVPISRKYYDQVTKLLC